MDSNMNNATIDLDKTFGDADHHIVKLTNEQIRKIQIICAMSIVSTQASLNQAVERAKEMDNDTSNPLLKILPKQLVDKINARVTEEAIRPLTEAINNCNATIKTIFEALHCDDMHEYDYHQLTMMLTEIDKAERPSIGIHVMSFDEFRNIMEATDITKIFEGDDNDDCDDDLPYSMDDYDDDEDEM